MEMLPVDSSNIQAIGYDPDTAILRISFHRGGEYEYYDVPQYEFDAFYTADSKGKYGHKNIYKIYRQQRIG